MKEFLIQKQNVIKLRTESVASRKLRLKNLRDWIHKNRFQIQQAVYDDFRRNPVETDGIEILNVLSEIKTAIANLESWASKKKVNAPLTMIGTRSYIQYEARGVCLILGPWNYPFLLSIGPLVSALAAGNAVILKPSELTPHVSSVIKRMSEEIFESSVVFVIEGGLETSQQLLKLPFDHIFFTGSPSVGKIVMKAAAENLSSVTLELGGKSPSIITKNANIKEAAERTAVAKFVNNGQTCVAPDYLLIEKSIADSFLIELVIQIKKLFLKDDETFITSTSYCRIINENNFKRLASLLEDAVAEGGKVVYGGTSDQNARFFHPTVVKEIPATSRIMQEEIFGPILPVLTFTTIDEAIAMINAKPKPLALYIFSNTKNEQNKILSQTSAGGVCINECAIHFLHHNLPFGGVNNSGIGKSHGYYGFLAFSNEKPVLKQRSGFTAVKSFYPPYTKRSRQLMDWFLKLF